MAGRTKKSSVWNYFKYNKERNKSICQVVVTRNKQSDICEAELSGMFASNLKKHLKIHHPDSYKKFEEEESRRATGKSRQQRLNCPASSSQQTLEETMPKLYPQDSRKAQSITKKLALFVGSTSVPLSLVECPEFQELLHEMDKQYKIPLRYKLGKEIDKLYGELKAKLSEVINNARRISICCDVWSKQGMTASSHCSLIFSRGPNTGILSPGLRPLLA